VIPAFTYSTGYVYNVSTNEWDPQTATYAGKNLANSQGSALIGNRISGITRLGRSDCMASNIPPKPLIIPTVVNVCHATRIAGFDLYLPAFDISTTIAAGNGHAADSNDVIEAFDYITGYTWSGSAWVPQTARFGGQNLGNFTRTMHTLRAGTVTRTLNGTDMLANGCGVAAVPAPPVVQHVPVSMCHATNGNGNDFYTFITTDDDAVLHAGSGHDGHADDVIPAFDYTTGYHYDGVTNTWVAATTTYAGKNLGTFTRQVHLPQVGTVTWTFNGQAMLDSKDCSFKQPAPKPPVDATPVTMCHAQAIAGLDTWVRITGTSTDVIGAAGHDADVNDVIPAFTYTIDFTYDATTDAWNPVTLDYVGKNLGAFVRSMDLTGVGIVDRTFNGSTLLTDGCVFDAVPPTPAAAPTPVTLCHAATVAGLDTYGVVVTDSSGVLGAVGHDADGNDIIPAFDYVTGYTYVASTNSWSPVTASYDGKNLGTHARTMNLSTGSVSVTINGAAMLASGTCAVPTVPVTAEVVPSITPVVSPESAETGGGPTPSPAPAPEQSDEPAPDAEPAPAQPVVAEIVADDGTLPFTGMELGILLLIGVGAIGAGTLAHVVRRSRRDDAVD
jgi:hypothetical protein